MNYSQFGQAEWILNLTNNIGINKGVCFEAGAASPQSISNSRCFIEAGWKAFLVEASSEQCQEWENLNLTDVKILNKKIEYGEDSLDCLLTQLKTPYDIDVFFLDIDGSEYQLINGMNQYRPKIICVEYDNSYPISIDFVPRQIRHSVESAQCSSKAMFRLMCEKGYTYINSFFLDHVFIANEVIAKNCHNFILGSTGRQAFSKIAPRNLYNYKAVLCNQESDNGGHGIHFYQRKLQNLLDNRYHTEASHYYAILSQIFHEHKSLIFESRGDKYAEKFNLALSEFDALYSDSVFYIS